MMKKVLVTGADGFIGSHVVEALQEAGYHVRAFCWYNAFNSLGWIDSLHPSIKNGLEIFMGDIRDPAAVKKAATGCDYIIHLAALITIPHSYHAPESYVQTNVTGTLNVLEAARETGAKHTVICSTSEVYGTAVQVPIEESHPLQAQSPYAASKIAADALAVAYYKSFDLPVSLARPFNTFGPRQSARAIIPTLLIQLLAGKLEIQLGNIKPSRDFVYVKDTASAFVKLLELKNPSAESFNICSGSEITIGDLANVLISKINPSAKMLVDKTRLRPENSEVYRLLGSYGKIEKVTGWQPGHAFDEALGQTIEWYRNPENRKLFKPFEYNI